MDIFQFKVTQLADVEHLEIPFEPNIFFLFVSPGFSAIDAFVEQLALTYPDTEIVGCSTSGEILGDQVLDDCVALTAIRFQSTTLRVKETALEQHPDSHAAGVALRKEFDEKGLRHIMVFSDGLHVNGAALVKGLNEGGTSNPSITGGLAGDGSDFKRTFTITKEGVSTGKIVALGLYGEQLQIGYGSKGGWDSFGMERLVTKSKDNVLYELDGCPALELYKRFLGDKAKELPSSGLLFPLSLRNEKGQAPVVRTILSVDEEAQSLTFAGDVPEGAYVRLMKANVDRLINGAEQSARIGTLEDDGKDKLAFLISCVGRRLVLKQLVEEEVEAVNGVLGETTYSTGFYSYGEIAPFDKFSPCSLHNQTMTITTLSE